MTSPTPQRPAANRRQGLAAAWALVIGVFLVGFCCGGITVITALSSALSA